MRQVRRLLEDISAEPCSQSGRSSCFMRNMRKWGNPAESPPSQLWQDCAKFCIVGKKLVECAHGETMSRFGDTSSGLQSPAGVFRISRKQIQQQRQVLQNPMQLLLLHLQCCPNCRVFPIQCRCCRQFIPGSLHQQNAEPRSTSRGNPKAAAGHSG